MGRPTKLTKEWLKVAEEVVSEDINSIILTDEELVSEINDRIKDDKAKISDRTFERWKSANKKEEELDKIGKDFCRLIKKALIKQKKHLFEKFRNEPNQWQKWAWIIERKFDEWNIKKQLDVTSQGEKLKLTFDDAFTRTTEENSE